LKFSGNPALFSLSGKTYGGDGQSTMAGPDMRGRVPVHANYDKYSLCVKGGSESTTFPIVSAVASGGSSTSIKGYRIANNGEVKKMHHTATINCMIDVRGFFPSRN